MLTELKLLHLYVGGLIDEAEAGKATILRATRNRVLDRVSIDILIEQPPMPVRTGCDHEYRRIASGEYECRTCGSVTDEPEGERWS